MTTTDITRSTPLGRLDYNDSFDVREVDAFLPDHVSEWLDGSGSDWLAYEWAAIAPEGGTVGDLADAAIEAWHDAIGGDEGISSVWLRDPDDPWATRELSAIRARGLDAWVADIVRTADLPVTADAVRAWAREQIREFARQRQFAEFDPSEAPEGSDPNDIAALHEWAQGMAGGQS